jgi:uncharacterized BrkB/YihY/UPF0761 family membrane protein
MKAPRLQSVIQRMLFAAERYQEHELANHAAAGAYAFLLSVAPAILLALSFTSALFSGNPRVVAEINRLVSRFLGPLSGSVTSGAFFGHRLGILAAAIGVVSLAWAARLFAVTVQRGIRVIWAATGKKTLVLGAGGAGKAVAYGAKTRGATVFLFDQARERADWGRIIKAASI